MKARLAVPATIGLLFLAACGGQAATTGDPAQAEVETGIGHEVPEDAAAVENPFEATGESIERGAALFRANCTPCHGEEGRGDGPIAAELDPPPANLHADYVQSRSDGALFFIISNGAEGTAMPAWDSAYHLVHSPLSEEDRWHVVNHIRTFGG